MHFNNRIFFVNDIRVSFKVANTLPLVITKKDALFKEHTIREAPGEANTVKIQDATQQDRFIPIGGTRSALTQNVLLFYYDKKYHDILITPDLNFLTVPGIRTRLNLAGYRLGSNTPLEDADITSMLGMSYETAFELPETKTGLKFKSTMMSLTGTGTSNNAAADRFEEMIDSIWNINHFSRRPSVIIDLGTPASLFKQPSPLYVYLLGQLSLMDYTLNYAGYLDVTDNLYLHFKF